ncbi:hypothetical protein DFH07DRAFT_974592 [Mycena maculata]|uniref:Uncharacterized protein n=1 Tax=Mycena maculata TaxID=230809 RepID=A0AAD7H894_9AGAR|nr:hypothetical protein DFH07DRAFT_974592 [Mycena maculata]
MHTDAAAENLQHSRKGESFATRPNSWAEELMLLREDLRRLNNLPPPTTDLQKGEIDLAHDLLISMIFLVRSRCNSPPNTTAALLVTYDPSCPFQTRADTTTTTTDPPPTSATAVAAEDDKIPDLVNFDDPVPHCPYSIVVDSQLLTLPLVSPIEDDNFGFSRNATALAHASSSFNRSTSHAASHTRNLLSSNAFRDLGTVVVQEASSSPRGFHPQGAPQPCNLWVRTTGSAATKTYLSVEACRIGSAPGSGAARLTANP